MNKILHYDRPVAAPAPVSEYISERDVTYYCDDTEADLMAVYNRICAVSAIDYEAMRGELI